MTTTDPRTDHELSGTQGARVGADPNLPDDQDQLESHTWCVVGDALDTCNGHTAVDVHGTNAVAGPTPEPTTADSEPKERASARDQAGGDHDHPEAHPFGVATSDQPGSAQAGATSRELAPILADPLLTLAADVLDDAERVRIADENRLRQLTRDEPDADGEERGFGLDERHPAVARLAALVAALAKVEHDAELELKRRLREHPLGPWVKQARGVGEKQAARLLAAIGDPYIRPEITRADGTVEPARPRTVSELWAYCGYHVLPAGHVQLDAHASVASGEPPSARHQPFGAHHGDAGGTITPVGQRSSDTQWAGVDGGSAGSNPDHERNDAQRGLVGVAATRRRNEKANWSATARMRAWNVAVSIVKAGGPYREVYDQGRAKYADAVHHTPCVRCGPSGQPAEPGTPLSDGHKHARALRLVSKEILKDLWREARRLHHERSAS